MSRRATPVTSLPEAESASVELLNGPDRLCECGDCDCANPIAASGIRDA